MNTYRIVLDAWHRASGNSYRVVLLRRGYSPREVVRELSTVYYDPETGRGNTTGGIGNKGVVLDEWSIVSVRKSQAKAGCSHAGGNHSDDLVVVYSGSTEPTIMCGYHVYRRGLGS